MGKTQLSSLIHFTGASPCTQWGGEDTAGPGREIQHKPGPGSGLCCNIQHDVILHACCCLILYMRVPQIHLHVDAVKFYRQLKINESLGGEGLTVSINSALSL